MRGAYLMGPEALHRVKSVAPGTVNAEDSTLPAFVDAPPGQATCQCKSWDRAGRDHRDPAQRDPALAFATRYVYASGEHRRARRQRSGSRGLRPARDLPIPGQQFGYAAHRVIGDAGEHVGEPCARVDVVELGGLDEGVDGGRTPASGIGAGKRPIAPADGDAAQG